MLAETIIPLFQPIPMLIRYNALPAIRGSDPRNASKIHDLLKLFLTVQVVADVVDKNLSLFLGLRILDQEGDSDGGAATTAEDLPTFTARGFALGALIASQMEDMNTGEFFGQALP